MIEQKITFEYLIGQNIEHNWSFSRLWLWLLPVHLHFKSSCHSLKKNHRGMSCAFCSTFLMSFCIHLIYCNILMFPRSDSIWRSIKIASKWAISPYSCFVSLKLAKWLPQPASSKAYPCVGRVGADPLEGKASYPHAGRAWLSFSLSFLGKSWVSMMLFRIVTFLASQKQDATWFFPAWAGKPNKCHWSLQKCREGTSCPLTPALSL
jgi:hypothetical protein